MEAVRWEIKGTSVWTFIDFRVCRAIGDGS